MTRRMALACLAWVCLVAPATCADTQAARSVGWTLQVQARVDGVNDNLSGLAYDMRHHRLLAVVNRPTELLVLDTDGHVRRRIALQGFDDTEGVALLTDGRVAVTEEGRNQVAIFAMPAVGSDRVRHRDARIFRLDLFAHGNNGFEGLAYDARHDCLWLAKERKPRGLYQVCGLLSGRRTLAVSDRSAWLAPAHAGTDLSGIEWDPASGDLLVLSDESRRITAIARGGRPVWQRTLGGADEPRPPQPEGITVDGRGHLYVVSEPNLFYRYGRD